MSQFDLDLKLSYNGMQAYGTAHHCQFIGFAESIAPLCRRSDQYTDKEKEFDIAIDEAGYIRLTTTRRLTRHMGNVIDEGLQKDVSEYYPLEVYQHA